MGPSEPSGHHRGAGYNPAAPMSPVNARALAPEWVTLVDALAPRLLGRADRKGDALAAAVARTSELYTREREAIGLATDALAARLRFFLLRDLPKIQGPLAELAAAGALPTGSVWRVIDVGAGLGTTSLGVAELARRAGVERVEVVALERDSAALDVFTALAREAERAGLVAPMRIDPCRVDLERAVDLEALGHADLVVMGLALNELFASDEKRLSRREAVLRALSQLLEEGGSLIVLEPALRSITRELMELRDRFAAAGAPTVFAPCLRDAPCPMLPRERDWCHAELPFALPPALAELAEAAGLRRERLTYSYLTLRNDERRLWDLASCDRKAYRIVGGPIASKGKSEWQGCGADAFVRLRRLDRERAPSNEVLDGAHRGSLIRLDRMLEDDTDLRLRPDVCVERLR